MSFRLPRLTHSVALGSLIAFAAQVVFALLMLKAFAPEEVGQFSVISQIAFFWMTLSLAQTPLSLLANTHLPPLHSARAAWRSSLWRALGLLPLALGALALSQLALWPGALWIVAFTFMQIAWSLAQSHVLRQGQLRAQIAVRALPPVVALVIALVGLGVGLCWPSALTPDANMLLFCALVGYCVGASWLFHAFTQAHRAPTLVSTSPHLAPHATTNAPSMQRDNRATWLRMLHSLSDALIATALIVCWQRLYGAQETGWLSALLRVFGFIPAVVHMAWAQVMLSHPHEQETTALMRRGLQLALLACLCMTALGLGCWLALEMGWLHARWQGLLQDLVPLALWQCAASLSAVFSYRPFQHGRAAHYSVYCMLLALLQALALALPWLGWSLSPQAHLQIYAAVSVGGLLLLSLWMGRLKTEIPKHG